MDNGNTTSKEYKDYYVYCLFNKDWNVPFYVGKGSERSGRIQQRSGRPLQVRMILSIYDCEARKLFCNMTEKDALKMEKYVKIKYKEMGFPILDHEKEGTALAQKVGIERAKAKGIKIGRPRVEKPDNWDEVIEKWKKGEITGKKGMELTGLKRSSFYKLIKEEGIEREIGKYVNEGNKKDK